MENLHIDDNRERPPETKPGGCGLTIGWFVGFSCAVAAIMVAQHWFAPMPRPIDEEVRIHPIWLLAVLFVCFASGFLGVWLTWRLGKYL